jgi:class 3 adenylate cyclase
VITVDGVTSYSDPLPTGHQPKRLVVSNGSSRGASFTFFDRIEIGRFREGRESAGLLLIKDPTVSSSHCIVTQEPGGRCYVRDTSRNGTRLDGRRLSPNLKTEFKVGQLLSVGRELTLRLEGEQPSDSAVESRIPSQTLGSPNSTVVTVLVGDIRDYTTLVQQADPAALQRSVAMVFGRLEGAVVELGGTLKEFQGDSLFAFWERGTTANHAADACRAALALDRLTGELAEDSAVWGVDELPLRMDWALATGPVTISGYGGDNALGLSMVGESVVLAFRIEKFANDDTGAIIACPATRMMAYDTFDFRDLGQRQSKGFDAPHRLYALTGERE